MLGWISKMWDINDPLPAHADVIALISYAATKTRLTNGSYFTKELALDFQRQYPNSKLIFGTFSKNPPGAKEAGKIYSLLPEKVTCVGSVSSSTDECEAILKAAGDAKSIIVVAEGWHSRRLKIVWKHFFKGELCFQSAPGHLCADPENPMWMQRYSVVWMCINMFFTPFYKFWPGVPWFAKQNFSQPAN